MWTHLVELREASASQHRLKVSGCRYRGGLASVLEGLESGQKLRLPLELPGEGLAGMRAEVISNGACGLKLRAARMVTTEVLEVARGFRDPPLEARRVALASDLVHQVDDRLLCRIAHFPGVLQVDAFERLRLDEQAFQKHGEHRGLGFTNGT